MDPEVHQLVVKDDKNELTEQSVENLKMKLKDLSTISTSAAQKLENSKTNNGNITMVQNNIALFENDFFL
ncbi:hypothetical protein TYRP_018454 [Tyrophagus putrescentiae]|nr:hypothetical protein TYRP_018454 [Tyrophagus putrescentiae]